MKEEILDTNVLLRFLVDTSTPQRRQAEQWFEEAQQGQRRIIVLPLVIAETCFVLESVHKKDREDIADIIEAVISQPWLMVEEREVLLGLWPWYRKKFHFVDSFLLSQSQVHRGTILTFDRKLSRAAKI